MKNLLGVRGATIVRGALIAVSLSCSVVGCSTEGPTTDTCAAIAGKTFESTTAQECGFQPGTGVLMCDWELKFASNGTFDWSPHSDTPQSGTYTCSGSVVNNSIGVDASYDQATGLLTWDRLTYAAQPP